MDHPKTNRIYKLPGIERGLIAVSIGDGKFFLYDREFGTRLPPRFEILADGRIVNWFQDFPSWTIEDLIDTGEAYQINPNKSD